MENDPLLGIGVSAEEAAYIATKLQEVTHTLQHLGSECELPLSIGVAVGGLVAQLDHTMHVLEVARKSTQQVEEALRDQGIE